MKKLLFVLNNLKLGGIQKSLINLLENIHNDYDIDLILFNDNDELCAEVPSNVDVTILGFPIRHLGIAHSEASKYGAKRKFEAIAFRVLTRCCFKKSVMKYILARTSCVKAEYDVAISYVQNPGFKSFYGGVNEYVLKKVTARKKISFLHADFSMYGGNNKYNIDEYKKFDTVVAMSNPCAKILTQIAPSLIGKVAVLPNTINYEKIALLSKVDALEYDNNFINLLTVARLSREKGQLRTVKVAQALKEKGIKFKWHFVGEGVLRKEFEQMICAADLSDCMMLHGGQVNPYRYMTNADLLIIPSFQEADCVVLKEALSLRLPVLTTNTISISDSPMLDKLIVCENDDQALLNKTLEVLLAKSFVNAKKNLESYVGSNDAILKAFSEIING